MISLILFYLQLHSYHTYILLLYISSLLCEKGENFIFTLANLIPRDCGLWSKREKKKKGGANRRVELDKVPRLQIRDWNLHDGIYIYKSFEDNKKIDEEIFWLFRFVLLLKNS